MRGKYQLISEQENRVRLVREGLKDEVLTATPETPSTGSGAESDPLRSPKVCIALLNWNGWQDTVECLTSLQKLNYPERQTIVIDSASTNDSVPRIRERFPEIEVIRLPQNLGFAGGCNVGIRHAFDWGAEYIWLLNNDTIVNPGALTAMVETAETDPTIGAVGSVIYDMQNPQKIQTWGGGRVSVWFGRASHHTKQTPREKLAYLTGASLLLRREALENVGLLDEGFFMYWEDTDLCFRLRKTGWKLAVADESQVWHKEGASLGRRTLAFDLHLWTSMVHFSSRHAPLSFVPTVIATVRMIAKRILQLRWRRAAQLCQQIIAGPRRSHRSAGDVHFRRD